MVTECKKHKRGHVKAPQKIFLNSLPLALKKKLGEEKTVKLCSHYDYISRAHRKKCKHCKSKYLAYRSTTRDYRCRICGGITPAESRVKHIGIFPSGDTDKNNR